ncbi:hypothetical protein PK98_01750 [Croceibacterium mercuriale]|uniref:DUF6894 domain-containing protein n=1 Tax=Croceibacterium mercuriale TaxID=1572751 RepID=A0A0B2C0C9_9SPHN|nr:hypothetical protein [Croceibacterium mercuriale]KHL25451.1 hypothetical protein PK98_01750 [Croceibacterium mercuriale]
MERFYTHVCKGWDCAIDVEGEMLADAKAAYQSAAQGARALVADEIAIGHNDVDLELVITNECGIAVALLPVTARTTGLP